MKKNLVGVMAVTIAALLFAGCGAGSKLSPAQKERCDELQRGITKMESLIPDFKGEALINLGLQITKSKKERADRGC